MQSCFMNECALELTNDETFMLVRSSKVLDMLLQNTTSAWRRSIVEAVTAKGSPVLPLLFLMIVIPLIIIAALVFFKRGQLVKWHPAQNENEAKEPMQRSVPSTTSSFQPWKRPHEQRRVESERESMRNESSSVNSEPPAYLCNELVVPPNVECEFALPGLASAFVEELRMGNPRECLVLPRGIADRTGKPLLRLALTRIPGEPPAPLSEYLLIARPDETEVAFCELDITVSANFRVQCSIFTTVGEVFARIDEEFEKASGERSFAVKGVHPNKRWTLRVHGDFAAHRLKMESVETGKVVAVVTDPDTVAFSSPPGEVYYKVRLASSADAALVIIALAAIDRIATLVPRYCDLPSSRSVSAKG